MSDFLLGDEVLSEARAHFPGSTLTYRVDVPAHASRSESWPDWVLPRLKEMLIDGGISSLYSHQAAVADAAWRGQDVVVATGTSSGKSLGYQLPVLTRLATDPTSCALYITPTKALGNDQLLAVNRWVHEVPELSGIQAAPYDGDTPIEARAGIRDHSRFVFTNPDMVHTSLLGSHQRWTRLLRHLDFIVIDECHAYRGVFGANVALVIRRLLRLAERYGSRPTVVLASATSADPGDTARRLTGRTNILEVTEDGAPTGARTIALWEPGFIRGAEGEDGAPVRRAATTEAAGLMASAVASGARTLTFVRSRRSAEIVSLLAQEDLAAMGRADFARRIAAYRAGYLAEDRRALERQLDEGELLGVATTNALELGIDVGGLDVVITAGFPGTIASFHQQAGRAGRRGQASVVFFVSRDDPMDTYLVHHPEALLGTPIEKNVFNPSNPFILRDHVLCAALEKPLTVEDIEAFGAHDVVEALTDEGLLIKRKRGWFPAPTDELDNAHSQVALRGGSGDEVMIVDSSDGRLLGTVDSGRACTQVHSGAVYLHQGEVFVIEELDLGGHIALASPGDPEYTTTARSVTDIHIIGNENAPRITPAPGLEIGNVDVEVTERVTGYVVRLSDGTVGDHIPLDLPEQRLYTRAVAYTVDPKVLDELGITAAELPGALHAAEHAAIGLLPLIATCDRWDIGGVSTALHPDTLLPTVFVYDGTPGGAGFADEGYARFHQWITATYEAVASCKCENGCPSCVQSPKCGNGNHPLDKHAALKLLGALSAMTA